MSPRNISNARNRFFEVLEPVSSRLSEICLSDHAPFLGNADLFKLLAAAQPGMLVFSRRQRKLSNLFVIGHWKHVGVITSSASQPRGARVVEASPRDGVIELPLDEFIRSSDAACLVAPMLVPAERWPLIAQAASVHLGKPYDFAYTPEENGKFYCSKLAYFALRTVLGREPFPVPFHWGGRGLMPNDFARHDRLFTTVLELRPTSTQEARPGTLPFERLAPGRRSRATAQAPHRAA
jgi:hypothetical protein